MNTEFNSKTNMKWKFGRLGLFPRTMGSFDLVDEYSNFLFRPTIGFEWPPSDNPVNALIYGCSQDVHLD